MQKCNFCSENLGFLPFKCHRCGKDFCGKHRLPEYHDCSQDLAVKKIRDDVDKDVLDKEYLPEVFPENEELDESLIIIEETITCKETLSGSFSMYMIKDHLYEIRYNVDKSSFSDFSILLADEKKIVGGESPISKKGKFTHIPLRTGTTAIHISYNTSLNHYPRLSVNFKVFDLGKSTNRSEEYKGIPINPEEKEVVIELEGYLKDPIPIVDNVDDETFGIVLKDGYVKQLGLHNRGLKNIPASIWNLQRLKLLNLSSNLIEDLPDIDKLHETLRELNLSHCASLQTLPERIDNFKFLKKLNLSYCRSFSNLPWKIKDLSGLTTIDISYCNFYILPDLENRFNEITESIDIRGNHFSLEERQKIKQLTISEVLVEPVIFFIEKESKLIEETPIETLKYTIKNDPNENNRVIALFIIIDNYFSKEMMLIKDVILNEGSALVITTLYKLLKKLNNVKSEGLRKEIIKRYSEIYGINILEVQFFIDFEAELVEEGNYEKIKVGHIVDYIYYGPVEPSIQDFGIEYDDLLEYFGNSDIFREPYWVNNGKVILLSFGGQELPESIGFLKDLEFLDLKGKGATILPQSFENLKKLRKFFVGCGFDFQNLNEKIKEGVLCSTSQKFNDLGISNEESKALACFEIIYGSFIQYSKIDENYPNEYVLNDQNQVIAISIYGDLENPDLSMNRKIPNEITLFENLEELLINYSILEIPESIGDLRNLKKLNLSNNKIKYLPNSLNSLRNLEELILNSNKFKIISNEFSNLQNLKRLELNYNKLKSIPNFVFELKNLKILDLSHNKISEIPNSIGKLTKLSTIDLGENLIQKIPNTFTSLKSLKSINLSQNRIKNIPESIENFLYSRRLKL